MAGTRPQPQQGIPFRRAFLFWLRLGFVSFGGPTGQIAIMHHELVERRRWIAEDRFLHALNYCMLLPGPEAQQLAIYVGWLLHRARGGLTAGVLFVLPASVLMLGLSWLYVAHGDVSWVAAIFEGLGAAVVGIVGTALIRVGRRALRNPTMFTVAGAAFAALFLFRVPFPAVVLGAGILGLAGGVLAPSTFAVLGGRDGESSPFAAGSLATPNPGVGRTLRVLAIGLAAWWLPLLLVVLARGSDDVFAREAIFFSKAAVVTFGGAYAVLAYLNQAAVRQYGWLTSGEMVSGLGLAETTPGPLILVTQFVGFVAAYRSPGALDPFVAGLLGSLVTLWATFTPSFLWIFLGAPYIERLRGNVKLTAALSTITAAVVGVILNLAVLFAFNTLFGRVRVLEPFGLTLTIPDLGSVDLFAVGLASVVLAGTWRYRWNVVPVVLASGAAGWLRSLVG